MSSEIKREDETAPDETAPSFEAEAAANQETQKVVVVKTEDEALPNGMEAPPSNPSAEEPQQQQPPIESFTADTKITSKKAIEEQQLLGDPIPEPEPQDVLSGRGASVNNHPGNKRFRALCFVRKPLFDAGNHAAKRRIATEIVDIMMTPKEGETEGARFLKRNNNSEKGPYYAMTREQAISKAQQVMRDYKRPDRIALRENLEASGQLRKRNRTTISTPIEEPLLEVPEEPIIENPFGVHAHDVLCGRGAFVNGHIGNTRLRTLALERKRQFDSGTYADKRTLATEIVQTIQSLSPPGRFLKRANVDKDNKDEQDKTGELKIEETTTGDLIDGMWEQLSDEKAIHKACQVMRDIDRPDRKHREERKEERKRRKLAKAGGGGGGGLPVDNSNNNNNNNNQSQSEATDNNKETETKDATLSSELAEQAVVDVVDNALEGAKPVEI
ncbi:hypothetical protein IV203_003928 [Nitzschia inconspicua]|uniref:DUF6824 domain-containing protein n=1 Tax=Nitzschia inconspicua TaxID=303405 RepID=A0A9K3L2Y6_9STRA|nr:hypothetical protein IV203_003928 [Nitzschia inconspicua]